MHISHTAERTLKQLAERGLWLEVHGTQLHVLREHADAGPLPDDLRQQLVSLRPELLQLIPALESRSLALTGPVVRVLFARLTRDQQRQPDLTPIEFAAQYEDLTMTERVVFLWWLMDGPLEERDARMEKEREDAA